jgi:hypothetical protein
VTVCRVFKLSHLSVSHLQTTLEQLEHDLHEVNSNKDALKKNYLELQELRHILSKATHFFEEVHSIVVLECQAKTIYLFLWLCAAFGCLKAGVLCSNKQAAVGRVLLGLMIRSSSGVRPSNRPKGTNRDDLTMNTARKGQCGLANARS